ncbi:MAG TPA: metalloregulator ArsR/SmtB family transcription factor [Pseudolabrys sp.]|nr:metalloregulator ArsR/SmtB family transcription factor [Pseudolabrys sp.]
MTDRLSIAFAALADPTRRAILARLALGETTVSELAKPFAMSGPAVSRHLKVLENAGLISRGREAQWRPCRIEPAGLKQVDDWLERYRQFWEQRLDRLEAYLHELQAEDATASAGSKSSRSKSSGSKASGARAPGPKSSGARSLQTGKRRRAP